MGVSSIRANSQPRVGSRSIYYRNVGVDVRSAADSNEQGDIRSSYQDRATIDEREKDADRVVTIEISDRQARLPINESLWRELVEQVLHGEGFTVGEISIAAVDDAEMHELNRRFLDHDYPTDVLSFVWECDGDEVAGEIIVSTDTAERSAAEFRWSADEELTLYVLHGLLHLVGYDDHEPTDRQRMREREDHYLRQLGRNLPFRAEN